MSREQVRNLQKKLDAAKRIADISDELENIGTGTFPCYLFKFGGAEISISEDDAERLARVELQRLKDAHPDLEF